MRHLTRLSKHSAFTLIELSIVLVILGLLIGGVLSGQSLIRAAELRSVAGEYQRYATAIGTFRDKYFALPGDISNAASIWSASSNGDGDSMIEGSTTAASNETGYFWDHLARALMVEGSYTPGSYDAISAPTTNPKAKLSPGTWSMTYIGAATTASTTYYDGDYGNAFIVMSGTSLSAPSGGVLKSEEAWNIDTKMDDGKPHTGSVLALESQGNATAGSGCGNYAAVSTATSTGTIYDLANTSSSACSLVFKSGY